MSINTNTHTPVNYKLDLSINHKTHNFTGSVTIDLIKNTVEAPKESSDFGFSLNASELIVTNAQINGVKATVKVNRPEELVTLKAADQTPFYSEASLSVEIQYIGKINQIKTFTDFTKGLFKTNYLDDKTNTSSNYILATHSQLAFARCIYPCVDEPSIKAQFQLSVKCFNPEFKVVSCTPIVSQTVDGETLTVQFQQTPPMATSIFGFALGDFEYLESKIKLLNDREVQLRFLTPVGQYKEAVYAFDVAASALPFVEKTLGHSFPLEKLDFVALPFLSDGAMENFGLVTIQSNHVLTSKLNNPVQLQQIRQLIVHELVHHWIGNYVSFNGWKDLWFNESFATWFAYYVLSMLKFDELDQKIWEFEIESSEKLFSGADHHAVVEEGSSHRAYKRTQDAFNHMSYQKGLQYLKMFANVIEAKGFDHDLSTRFVPLLTKFLNENQFKGIDVEDFWKFLDCEITEFNFAEFVRSWLTSEGLPIVLVKSSGENMMKLSQLKFGTLQQSHFHIPLLIRDPSTGKIVNKIMDTPEFELPIKDFAKLNSENIGTYKVQYNDMQIIDQLLSHYEILSKFDKINLINDLTSFIGSELYHNTAQIEFLYKLSLKVFEHDHEDLELLNIVLPTLEKFNNLLKLSPDLVEKYTKFNNFLQEQTMKIYSQLDPNQQPLTNKSDLELELLNLLLSINHTNPTIQSFASKQFKQLFQGIVPTLILPSIFQIVSSTASLNQWKKILELIKTPIAVSNHIQGELIELQTAAIKSIGYNSSPEMIKRTFNFVLNNFDMQLVELALIGLTYNFQENKGELLHFLNVNLSQLYKKSVVKNNSLTEVYAKNLNGLVCLIFNGLFFVDELEIKKLIEKFEDVKILKQCYEDVKQFNKGNVKIVQSLEEVVDQLL